MSATMEPFRRELSVPDEMPRATETEFEKPRGVNKVEIRRGYCTVHVSNLDGDVNARRVEVLSAITASGVSLDFLKLTPGGLSFLVPESAQATVEQALADRHSCQVTPGRCIVLAHAANMRDEEGLIAQIVSEVIGTGVQMDHLGDMHDRVLMVMDGSDGERVAQRLRARLEGP